MRHVLLHSHTHLHLHLSEEELHSSILLRQVLHVGSHLYHLPNEAYNNSSKTLTDIEGFWSHS